MQVPFVDPLLRLEVPRQTLPLVGRSTEIQLTRLLLSNVALSRPEGIRALVISGEVGVGKSRILTELYAEATALHFRVLEGSLYNADETSPYQPFVEVLRPLLHTLTREQLCCYTGLDTTSSIIAEAEQTSLLGAPLIAALTRLFPELPELLKVAVDEEEILSPDQEKFRLLDAIATFLERLATERPVVLGIDNLQWADSASLELMLYLTVRLHHSPIVLVGVTRPSRALGGETGNTELTTPGAAAATAKVLRDLMRHGLLMLLPLSPLSEDAATQHLHSLLPGEISPSLVQLLLSRAEGNPFFLEELVRMLTMSHQLVLLDGKWQITHSFGTALPDSITEAVGQRLQELSGPCRAMLRVAALIGHSFPLAALIKVCEGREEQIVSLLEEAISVMVIARAPETGMRYSEHGERSHSSTGFSNQGTTYMFCQSIVQEVLSAEVSSAQLQTLHSAIGTALEVSYGNAAQLHATEIAHHYILSDNRPAALYWCLVAGEEAARKQAHRESIQYSRLAIDLLDKGVHYKQDSHSRSQLYTAIGISWFKLGELEQASTAFQQALDLLRQADRTNQHAARSLLQVARVNRLLADVYRIQAKYEQAQTHLQAARTALDTELTQQDTSQDITDASSEREVFAPWFTSRRAPSSTGNRSIKQAGTTEHVLLLQAEATLDIMHYHTTEAEQALRHSLQLATELGDRESQAFALYMLSWILGWGERIHGAIRLQKQAQELYIAIGDPFRATLADQSLGIIYYALGEMEQAHLYTLRGLERARRYGVGYALGWLYWNQSILALTQGDWTKCETHLQEAMQETEGNIRLLSVVLQTQAELHFRRGNWQEAEQVFLKGIQEAATTEWYPSTLAMYGHFLAVTGRRAEAGLQLRRAADMPEPPGYAGHFYIPSLVEGYIHLGTHEQATYYIERIRGLRGFMYYGLSVDRILGVVAALSADWEIAEQAFEEGLRLCQRANNQPELAMILYEQARMLLLQSGTHHEHSQQTIEQIHQLCNRARDIFSHYGMQRSIDLVNTLQEGIRQLTQQRATTMQQTIIASSDYHLVLTLTKRELDVLRLVAEGHTDREVADILVISPRTVNRHLSNIFVKLDVPGRASAVAYAIRQGLV